MSRIYQRSGHWWGDYTDETGRRIRIPLTEVKTRTEARDYLAELVAKTRRRKLGLEAAPVSLKATVWQLCEWWLENKCGKPSLARETYRLNTHVKGSAVGEMQAAHVRPSDFEALFDALASPKPPTKPAAPSSINHVRAKLRTVFEAARRMDIFTGVNPVRATKLRTVVKRHYDTLTAEEIALVLRFTPEHWRGFFAAAAYLALRKGECAGLRKADVDLAASVLTVRRSYNRDTTKGGKAAVLPIPAPLRPHIEAAMKTPGVWLFPNKKGAPRTAESDPHLVLARAMTFAGLTGRHVRFHDLRHSCATILFRAGVDAHRVQRILRHASINTTTGTYAHLMVDDLREALGVLGTGTNPAQIDFRQDETKREAANK
jgi:integrase